MKHAHQKDDRVEVVISVMMIDHFGDVTVYDGASRNGL